MRTDYRYGIFDAQIMLVTDYHLLKARGQLTKGALITKFFQSVVKCIRDYCNCDRIVLVWDKGPYYRSKIVQGHKGDRFYVNEQVVENYEKITPCLKEDRERYIVELIAENKHLPQEELDELINDYRREHPTQEEYEEELSRLNFELSCEKIKGEAKYWIIDNFSKIGMPSLIYDGYEADDLALICLDILRNDSSDNRFSYICSKDSDWQYLLTPKSELIKYHRGTMYKFDEVTNEIPEELRRRGVGAYLWKAVNDSLKGSHNNFQNCLKDNPKFKIEDIFEHLDDINWLEQYCDTDIFIPQLKSFDVTQFEDYKDVRNDIENFLLKEYTGSLLDEKLFSNFTAINEMKVSTKYYSKYCELICNETYKKENTKEEVDIDKLLASI